MRATKSSVSTEGTLIADYEAAIGESLSREQMRSALHAARAQAEMAIRARSDFLANMNHELRTPLNAIIGFTTMVRDAQGLNLSDEQKQDYCDYILQSADLLLGHVNTLLEVAELEKGDVVFNAERVDIVEVLDNVLARAARPAETAKLIIEKNACGEEAYAVIDALRLGQALDELMKIALRVTPEGGKIFVRVKRSEDGDIEIAIRDEGPGMSDDETAEALSVFERPEVGLDRPFSGPGVGFAIAKILVEYQGGNFLIDSRPGQGTLVRMSFPDQRTRQPGPASLMQNAIVRERSDDAA